MHEKNKNKRKTGRANSSKQDCHQGECRPAEVLTHLPCGDKGPTHKNTVTGPVNYSNGPGQMLMRVTVNESIIMT